MKKIRWIIAMVVVVSCVEPISFNSTVPEGMIILDGMISAEPGPYIINLSRGQSLSADSTQTSGVTGASIVLHSDQNETEPFTETSPGVYKTGGAIQGMIGSTYYISISMADGSTFESEPELLRASGEIKDITYQYEHRTTEKIYGLQTADVFNLFVDADASISEGDLGHIRWRFTGTYKVQTNPERHMLWLQGEADLKFMNPYECSGYVVEPAVGGGELTKERPCTCCECWIRQYETMPRLADNDLVAGGQFRNFKVGEIPITRATFVEKYKVEIEQMSISEDAYEFFKVIRAQKENATNIFQPPPGKLTGNIKPVNAKYNIIGLFWAASTNRKSIYIHQSDVPYKLAYDTIPYPCNSAYANSSTTKPEGWDEEN